MTKKQIIDYLQNINVRADIKIEDIADDLAVDEPRGLQECFHCGAKAVGWLGDFTGEEYGQERDGIIHECECRNCGAQITYYIPFEDEE